jgi:hypothetical protein
MRRTWMLLIGATLLWLCACAAAQESTDPSPGDGGVTEVTDPGSSGESGVADPGTDAGDHPVAVDTIPPGETIVSTGPVGDVPALIAAFDPTDQLLHPIEMPADDGDNAGEGEAIGTALTADYRILTQTGESGGGPSVATTLANFASRVGIVLWGDLAPNVGLNLDPGPQVSQLLSDIGLGTTRQLATFSNATGVVADLTAQFGAGLSQVSSHAPEAFAAVRIPDIPSLIGDE